MTVLTSKKAIKVAVRWVELEDYERETGEWFNKSQFERVFNVRKQTAKKYAQIYRKGGKKAVIQEVMKLNRQMLKRMEKARLAKVSGFETIDKLWRKEFQGQDKFNALMGALGGSGNYND